MKTIATLIAGMASGMSLDLATEQTWTSTTVSPPPEGCCTGSWTSDEDCDVLQNAIDAAAEYTTLLLEDGVYCNKNFKEQASQVPWDYKHQALAKIRNTSHLRIRPADSSTRPLLRVDGWSGIQVRGVSDILIQGLEIEGPALRIDGVEASAEHERLTGRDTEGDYNCGRRTNETWCGNGDQCRWSSHLDYCIGVTWSYYNGKGIEMREVEDVTIRDNIVHHTTSSGIRCDRCNDVQILSNVVYGTVWWTTTGASAIVFAESQGSGELNINNNVVYGNRNCLPFFLTSSLAHFGAGVEHYGEYNQARIVDGSGVYITRNLDFEGTMNLRHNVAYDNGINGVVVHKTTHDNVTVNVVNNRVFDNGVTTKNSGVDEGRQDAGGLTINSGSATSNVYLLNNKVVADVQDDMSYQCFGTCNLTEGSGNNIECGGGHNNQLGSDGWRDDDETCSTQRSFNDQVRASYPDSHVPRGTQFTPWVGR